MFRWIFSSTTSTATASVAPGLAVSKRFFVVSCCITAAVACHAAESPAADLLRDTASPATGRV